MIELKVPKNDDDLSKKERALIELLGMYLAILEETENPAAFEFLAYQIDKYTKQFIRLRSKKS